MLLFEGLISLHQLRTLIVTRVLSARASAGLRYPRLTQCLTPRLGGFVWEVDPEFAIQNHVFSGPCSLEGEDRLEEYVGKLVEEELNARRPLWEVRLLSPYGRMRDSLLLVRTHMALADGSSLLRILTESLADRESLRPTLKPTFGAVAFSFNLLRSLIVGPLTFALWLFSTSQDINPITQASPECEIGEKVSKNWQVAWSSGVSVPQVSRVKQIMRSSFNDVLLSATAGKIWTKKSLLFLNITDFIDHVLL